VILTHLPGECGLAVTQSLSCAQGMMWGRTRP
jgi:hypothetical protein